MRACLVAVLALTACRESARPAPPTPKPAVRAGDDADALWALAPDGLVLGEVVTPHGALELERGLARLRQQLSATPDARRELETLLLASGIRPFERFADLGLSTERGLAMFDTPLGTIVVLPVVDRDRFVKKLGGTRGETDAVRTLACAPTDGRYVCASSPAVLARLGKGPMRGKLAAAGGRGDVEIFVGRAAFGTTGLVAGYIALGLEDGVLDAHGFFEGSVPAARPFIGALPLTPDPHAGGFALANLAAVLADLPAVPVGGGVTAREVGKSMTGAVTATMSATDLGFRVRAPLADSRPWQALIASCDQLGTMLALPMHAAGNACHVAVPGALVPVAFDAWVEGGELRVGNHPGPFVAGKSDALTAIGRELASGAWTFALWGRGTLFSAKLAQTFGATLDPVAHPELPNVLRAIAQFDELGLGGRVTIDGIAVRAYARTIWANPTDVAEQVAAIAPAELISGGAEARAAAIAAAHPHAPFAADLAAGPGGMMMPAAAIGILAGVAVPAFMDYMKKARKTDAERQLARLGAHATAVYTATGKFPTGFASLTPADTCCHGPHGKCVWTDADRHLPVWQALDFVLDQPELYQYGYASDGTAFNATAVGDLDCDGIAITYTLSGTSDHGVATTSLTKPPPNSD